MPFSKTELQDELREFMIGFARSAERIFGPSRGGALLGYPDRGAYDVEPSEALLDKAWLWIAVMEMYDYGIQGLPHPSFGAKGDVGNHFGEAEMFLLGLDGLNMFLEEDDVRIPTLARRTVKTAMARHLLDGGERYLTREEDELAGYLSFAEVALLADMDERSVRNAANPKLPDALVTKNFGRRSMISIEDARRWLMGRKGFVPTKDVVPPEPKGLDFTHVMLPFDVQVRLDHFANEASLPRWELLTQLLDRHERGWAKGEDPQ